MSEHEIGTVTHYFSKLGVAAIQVTEDHVSVGDTIHVKGHTSDFSQTVESMQVDGAPVHDAFPGQSIGVRVLGHAREHDHVFKID
jgi:hypothetical protein